MILTTCIPVGAKHHSFFMKLMILFTWPRLVPDRDHLLGKIARLSMRGYPVSVMLDELPHLAVRMDLGISCAYGSEGHDLFNQSSQLILLPLVLKLRIAK